MLTYTVDYVQNTPYDARIIWDLPLEVFKNIKNFSWLNEQGLEEHLKKDHWVVLPSENVDLNFLEFFEHKTKQFKDLEKAIQYAHKNYVTWLKKRLEESKASPILV